MARHRYARQPAAGIRGLVISSRDLLLLAICVGGLLASWLVYGVSGPPDPVAFDAGTRLLSSPPPANKPAANQAAVVAPASRRGMPLPAASAPLQITYPAAGLNVVVHPLRPDPAETGAHSIEPPETMDGYWLSPFGTPGAGSTNTTYVIGHSWEGLDAPFNHLSYAAAPGDELKVVTETGAMTYKVESVTTYTKSTLKDSPIWTAVPSRLVLISCYTQDLWGKNVAVVASPVLGR
ncbi:class F sortase [Arthrobacter sp. MMS18-M83]|uniref:class F sortase n=1 Tax=Arthrobacter sp. MMS18-M83 TaxID=2996261 RepID=UPI00227BD41B|nr:sortase [Arthrobacter sp. MMS18-M83]WAH96671.1 class F sortase [Arthrobacter sp. MMS18-M83]